MKKLVRILVVIVVVIVVIVFTGLIYVDGLARKGIEAGTAYATGVSTTLAGADVAIFSGELKIDNLNIANPEGFTDSEHFLKLGQGYIQVGLASLMKDQVEIPVIALRDIELVVERIDGKNNFDAILEHLKQLSSGEKDDTTQTAGKNYNISELTLENVSVRLKGFGVSIPPIMLPTIKLTNVGSGGEGVAMSKVVGIVIRELLNSLLNDPSRLPDALIAGLREGLKGLGDLGEVGVEALEQVSEVVEQVSQDVEKAVEDFEKAAQDIKGVADSLGQLFGNKKDDEKE